MANVYGIIGPVNWRDAERRSSASSEVITIIWPVKL
jgi:hypothetical protein